VAAEVVEVGIEIEIDVVKTEANQVEMGSQTRQRRRRRPTTEEMVDITVLVGVIVVMVGRVKEVAAKLKQRLLTHLHQTKRKMFHFLNQNLPKKRGKKRGVRRN
jgi:hypothetical protein